MCGIDAEKGGGADGFALVTVMAVIILIAAVAASVISVALRQASMSQRSRDYMKAQLNAESGVNAAYSTLKTNFAARYDPLCFPCVVFTNNGGSYDATVVPVGSNMACISCVGTYGPATAVAKMDVRNWPYASTNDPPPLTDPYGFGIFVNGYCSFSGSGQMKGAAHINDYWYCNGNIAYGTPSNAVHIECSGGGGFSGNNGTIYGTVRAPAISFNGTITSPLVTNVAMLTLPFLDLTPYYNIAVSNGQVSSSLTVKKSEVWGSIPGGVKWINGSLTVNGGGSVTCTGCVIATGAILINGTFNGVPVGNMPTLVSRDSTVDINGSHNIRGLLYSRGNMGFNGAGTITGEIMVGGNLTFNGSSSVNVNYMYCEPGKPGYETWRDRVVVQAWQE